MSLSLCICLYFLFLFLSLSLSLSFPFETYIHKLHARPRLSLWRKITNINCTCARVLSLFLSLSLLHYTRGCVRKVMKSHYFLHYFSLLIWEICQCSRLNYASIRSTALFKFESEAVMTTNENWKQMKTFFIWMKTFFFHTNIYIL